MRSDKNHPSSHGETRRQFIKKSGMAAAAIAGAGLFPLSVSAAGNRPAVAIVRDRSDAVAAQPPVQWAMEQLRDALDVRGIPSQVYSDLGDVPPSQEAVL